jgi:hypothetical protein
MKFCNELACARIIKYNRKLRSKLKRTFTIVNYDPKPFIEQATGLLVIACSIFKMSLCSRFDE